MKKVCLTPYALELTFPFLLEVIHIRLKNYKIYVLMPCFWSHPIFLSHYYQFYHAIKVMQNSALICSSILQHDHRCLTNMPYFDAHNPFVHIYTYVRTLLYTLSTFGLDSQWSFFFLTECCPFLILTPLLLRILISSLFTD